MTKNRIHTGQHNLFFLADNELIVDNFAGGGGASSGIEKAFGRTIDIAINHDPEAIALHKANHPNTKHYCESVWDVDPRKVTNGQPVGLAWFSPDCTHFSKAKGGKPVKKEIRGLAWVAKRWAATVRPRIIMLENVEEFKTWGPLTKDGLPDKSKSGKTFNRFVNSLKKLGYDVEYRELVAADFGAPTTRKRFFMIARCDGLPIAWPEPTHTQKNSFNTNKKLKPWRAVAECIDWSQPVPSIFTREKPLVENTMKRIARGVQRFVLDNPEPFILRAEQAISIKEGLQHPLNTSLKTKLSNSKDCLVMPWIAKHFTGATGSKIDKPMPTMTASGAQNQYAHVLLKPLERKNLSFITKYYGTNIGTKADEPLHTITSGGGKFGLVNVECEPVENIEQKQSQFYAFMTKYYSTSTGSQLNEPLHTVPTKDRFGLVIVEGRMHQIVDIGMRMLTPREQYLAQGFEPDYKIDIEFNNKPLTKKAQQRMCGNSVSPVMSFNLVKANLAENVSQVA